MSSELKSLVELTEKLEYEELKEENERLKAENKKLKKEDLTWFVEETRGVIAEYKRMLESDCAIINTLSVCIAQHVKREHWPRVVVELCGVSIGEVMNGFDKEV